MSKQKQSSKRVTITRVEKARSAYGGLRVHFTLGRARLSVCVGSEDFSERNLKKAMAVEIACEFAFRQARAMIGESFSIDDIIREYPRGRDSFDML